MVAPRASDSAASSSPQSNAVPPASPASADDHGGRIAPHRPPSQPAHHDASSAFANLDELAVSPIENPYESPVYRHSSLEQARGGDHGRPHDGPSQGPSPGPPAHGDAEKADVNGRRAERRASRLATQIYTLSYLVFFAILGTLARLGLAALTSYPGSPGSLPSVWPNFAGSLVMGFLAEDRLIFRDGWAVPDHGRPAQGVSEHREAHGFAATASSSNTCGASARAEAPVVDLAAAKRAHLATKKTIPLYIGLATGFCGCLTSFSAFVRDVFLALSNDADGPGIPRNGGYSFMAVLAVILFTVSLAFAGLLVGAHLAIALEPLSRTLLSRSFPHARAVLDRLVVVLGWGCWLGAVLLSALPPDRGGAAPETWRGRVTFSLVFAPLGCLLRFWAALHLNGRVASFPLGTFAVNMLGTLILGMSWDLAHVPVGGIVGCQVLQGVEDGFCGCLTTVSTWVAELAGLQRRHAYVYGTTSVLVALALLTAVMGGLRWSDGFSDLQCVH